MKITKKMKERVDSLRTQVWDAIKSNYGSPLAKDDKLQMKDGQFLCDKCGETGTYDNSFNGCPNCHNTNYMALERFNEYSRNSKTEVYSIYFKDIGVRAIYQANTKSYGLPEVEIEFLLYIVEQNGEIGVYDYTFKRVKQVKFQPYYSQYKAMSTASLIELQIEEDCCFIVKETLMKKSLESAIKSRCFNETFLCNNELETVKWKGTNAFDLPVFAIGQFHENSSKNKFGEAQYYGVCGKCGQKSSIKADYENTFKCCKCGETNHKYFYDSPNYKTYACKADNLQLLFVTGSLIADRMSVKDKSTAFLCQISRTGDVDWYVRNDRGEYTPAQSPITIRSTVNVSDSILDIIEDFEGTKYTGWNEFRRNVASYKPKMLPLYFDLLSKDRRIERIAKAGLTDLVVNFMSLGLPKDFQKFEKMPKGFLKLLKNATATTSVPNLIDCYKRDPNLTWEDFTYVAPRYRNVQDILRLKITGLNVAEIAKYIKYVDEQQACPPSESLQLWDDYLRMLKRLGVDFSDRRAVYPNSLKREHDQASRKVQILRDEKECQRFTEKVSTDKYKALAYKGNEYSVVTPTSPEDLFEEGRKLNHCVGTYVGTVASGYSKIVFVRQNGEIEKPLATMEIRGSEIIQIKGFSNIRPSNKVMDFVKNEYAINQHLLVAV